MTGSRASGGEARWSGAMRPRFGILLTTAVAALLAFGAVAPAQADFKVCNQTLNLFNLAVGYEVGPQLYKTEGWWTLAANSCVSLINRPLESRFVYVYGTDIYGDEAVVGSTQMCVDPKQYFVADDAEHDCWVRGYEGVRFFEVDTQNASTWTMFIREN